MDAPLCFVKKGDKYDKINMHDGILDDIDETKNVLIMSLIGFTFGFDVKN
jgi:hypothetical protein